MNIALDATYSLGDNLSGVGVYSREILHGLAAAHPETRFRFCYRPHRYARSFREPLPPNCRRGWLGERWAPWAADLFHGLNQRLPARKFRRRVATFHDLFVITGEYSTAEFRLRFTEQARHAAAAADAIIAVSRFTAGQVEELLAVDPARVRVIHHGVRVPPRPRLLREPVVLHVGAVQKRKNVLRLVEAFETLDPEWKLVLVGSDGYGAAEIHARICNSPARARILTPGYATPEMLGWWYSRASIFAFPSLDEGFGMPVLEAMAWGVPVITSNRSALAEIAGNAALLVDPENVEALSEALRSLARNESLQNELRDGGFRHAEEYSWEKALDQTWSVYRSLLG